MEPFIFSKVNGHDFLVSLPSPKVRPSDRSGVHGWYHDYTAFSEGFALGAIEAFSSSKDDLVLDPFLGSGTSLVAAVKLGLSFIGVELSPFLALLGRAKFAFNANPSTIFNILKIKPMRDLDISAILSQWYSTKDLLYAAGVITKISKIVKKEGKDLLQSILTDQDPELDNIVVALVSLLISARSVAKLSSGSNPVWTRPAIQGEISLRRDSLIEVAVKKADTMLSDLKRLKKQSAATHTKIIWGDTRSIPLPSRIVDLIITSPPYLNRLDYVISQQPELQLLSLLHGVDMNELRRQMIGTTKIVEKGNPEAIWGPTCIKTLKTISTHPSKASNTYYIWNYYKYFKDIYRCLSEFKRLARPGAKGILVVQNSHYKDIAIPISNIFIEMGYNIGIEMKEIQYQSVRTHMGLLSPWQRHYSPSKTLKEVTLLMNFLA